MKVLSSALIILLCGVTICFAQNKELLLDDFQNQLVGGPDGTVDFGAGNGSAIEVSASTDIKYSGSQSLKVTYNAVGGGYMWVARGFGLDAKNAAWLVKPEDIKWSQYNAVALYVYGSDSKTKIAFDIKDNGNEMWRYVLEDNFKGWKRMVLPFKEFFARGDWQPDTSDRNANLDFPVKSFQFEPLPEAKGVLYFGKVELLTE